MALDHKQTIVLSSKIFGKDQKFKAEIQGINADSITVELSSTPVEIPAGTPLSVWFWDEAAIFSFETEALTPKNSIVSRFTIKRPENVKKSFKRNYKRVRIKLQAVIKEVNLPEKENVYITDLSASGAKVVAKSGRSQGGSIKISFTLPDGQEFEEIGCDIMRVTKLKTGLVEYGLEFKVLSKLRQQKIFDFIATSILSGQVQVIE